MMSDLELEYAVLLACIENNENIAEITNILSKNDFSNKKNGEIYEFLINKHSLNEGVDLKLLKLAINLSDFHIKELENANSFINVKEYAKILKDLSIKRNLFALCSNTISEIKSNIINGYDYAANFQTKLIKILESKNNESIKSSHDGINEFFTELSRVANIVDKNLIGLDTGLSMLNYYTKGLKAGELVIIAARPGNGKTTLALNIVLAALKRDKNVLFFSLEQEAHSLFAKLISSDTSVNLSSIIEANLSDVEIESIQHSANFLSEKKLFVYDGGFLNIDELRLNARKYHKEHKLDLIILDYIGLMSSNSKLERHLQVAEITRNLKMLALELKIPIIALSQLNRAMESRANKKPMLSDLRESGSIEQDADIVLFLSENENPRGLEERPTILTIAKNRRGECGDIFLDFKARISKFCQIDTHTTEFI